MELAGIFSISIHNKRKKGSFCLLIWGPETQEWLTDYFVVGKRGGIVVI